MSEASVEERPQLGADKIILGVLAALVIGAMFYVASQRNQTLRASPAGFNGLKLWLTSQDIQAQNFNGGWPLTLDEVGLVVLPLYDTELDRERTLPQTKKQFLFQQDENDRASQPFMARIGQAPTLLVLPKWRSGMRLTKSAHPILLSKPDRIQELANTFVEGGATIKYSTVPFTKFTYDGADGQLNSQIYAAQTFSAAGCKPIVGTERAMILGDCPLKGSDNDSSFLMLSDPDLLNNHGLVLGDNAFIAKDLIVQRANDKRVIIDYAEKAWFVTEKNRVSRERTWADLKRFFSPPFTLIWIGFGGLIALSLWRAAMRFGPVIRGALAHRIGASKMLAIGAQARLLRLSNRDGSLAASYGKARLAAKSNALFGPAQGQYYANPENFLDYVKRRHPNQALALSAALNTVNSLPASANTAQAMASIADLDRILEQITNDT